MEIFLFIALVIFVLAVAKWNQGKDKPIEFDTPELKARREKFEKAYVGSQEKLRILLKLIQPMRPLGNHKTENAHDFLQGNCDRGEGHDRSGYLSIRLLVLQLSVRSSTVVPTIKLLGDEPHTH